MASRRRNRRKFRRGDPKRRYVYTMLWEIVNEDTAQRGSLPDLDIPEILTWADRWYARTGRWPERKSGPIPEAPDETWRAVDAALTLKIRGIQERTTLARLLAQERGRYHRLMPPQWTERYLLRLADAWHKRFKKWPQRHSGEIPGLGGVTWNIVNHALRKGRCGLPGGSSLAQLLSSHGRIRDRRRLPRFTIKQILNWADLHRRRNGTWPTAKSGHIPEAPAENWSKVNTALRAGLRGLRGGSSLARLLAKRRGVRNPKALPPHSEQGILRWADEHHRRTGEWPTASSGRIRRTNGENWHAVDVALTRGVRGLAGGSSLAQLLAKHRGVRNRLSLPRLTERTILAWADAFQKRIGAWPKNKSASIREAPRETWLAVDMALRHGGRGLPSGSSLARLLAKRRGVRNRKGAPKLTERKILAWADAYHQRTGKWPTHLSGPIPESGGETWSSVHSALYQGARGFPGGSSLARLLERERGRRNVRALPRLTTRAILRWAKAHYLRAGKLPSRGSGEIPEAPGEQWTHVDDALRRRGRGLTIRSSLHLLLQRHFGTT